MRALLTILLAFGASAQEVYQLPTNVETRWFSPENPKGLRGAGGAENAGRKGRASISVKAGETITLAEMRSGSGTVRRIWMTVDRRDPQTLRSLRLTFYWDGASRPAIDVPVGDFFGVGLGLTARFQSVFFASPEGRSFNSFIPMPFRNGMRIVFTNESARDLQYLFYDVDVTAGDRHDASAGYLHAWYHRENPTRMQQDYEILPRVAGRGRYLGCNFGVAVDRKTYLRTWWGEGEVKIYLDGDRELPTLSGTGTEDYIGDGWGQGPFNFLYTGSTVADGVNGLYAFYRYHAPDPVWFRENVRVTIQQMGYANEKDLEQFKQAGTSLISAGPGRVPQDFAKPGLFERQDDWSSCAYFYLSTPVNSLPPLDPVAKRIEGLVSPSRPQQRSAPQPQP